MFADIDASWFTHTGTALLAFVGGVIGTFFYARKLMRDDRKESLIIDKEANANTLAHDHAVSEEVMKLAKWQSEIFRSRMEEMEVRIVALKKAADLRDEAMRILHMEHMECVKKSTLQEGKINALEQEVKRLTEKSVEADSVMSRLEKVARELVVSDAEIVAGKLLMDREAAKKAIIDEAAAVAAKLAGSQNNGG